MAPRHVLRNVLELYAQRGWEPVVALELEFYLIEQNKDSDYPLRPPVGRSGRAEPGRQSHNWVHTGVNPRLMKGAGPPVAGAVSGRP